ncbi:MAG: arsenate reductase ArsC [Ignavibacteriae bacterium]|nr:arsenate reductase ArsC [Ignavibacteriota bacterium]
MAKKILILCTGNSCRSQMAEGFLKKFGPELQVFSAGTYPAKEVNPNSITVMKEAGIDISSHKPKDINEFTDQSFDFVITVCDNAKEICPVFNGEVKNNLHISFVDPADAKGSKEKILEEYREVRDEIRSAFRQLYLTRLKE